MRKYIILSVIFILIIILLIWMNKLSSNLFDSAAPGDSVLTDSSTIKPMIVVITPIDDFYHKPDCIQIGKDALELSINTARREGYTPCPYCFKKDSTANESR